MISLVALSSLLLTGADPAPNPAAARAQVGAVAINLPPRLLEVKPDADGKIRFPVIRPLAIGAPQAAPGAVPGANVPRGGRIQPQRIELEELKDLVITTIGGKDVSKEDATKALKSGGVVIIPADGKSVPDTFRKLFKDDALILTSPDLTGAGMGGFGGGINIQLLPANGGPWGPGGVPGVVPNPQKSIN